MTDIVERLRKKGQMVSPFDEFDPPQQWVSDHLCAQAADEIDDLRQAIWDAYAIMGGDNDGMKSHKGIIPNASDWANFLRDLATEWRKDYDDACNEAGELERGEAQLAIALHEHAASGCFMGRRKRWWRRR